MKVMAFNMKIMTLDIAFNQCISYQTTSTNFSLKKKIFVFHIEKWPTAWNLGQLQVQLHLNLYPS